jgi:hypothetical protein
MVEVSRADRTLPRALTRHTLDLYMRETLAKPGLVYVDNPEAD